MHCYCITEFITHYDIIISRIIYSELLQALEYNLESSLVYAYILDVIPQWCSENFLTAGV